jgi:hypothetical protein
MTKPRTDTGDDLVKEPAQPVRRFDRDAVRATSLIDRSTIRTDAMWTLFEAVQRLEASLDRAVRRAEDARAKSERLTALVDGAVQNIYAEIETERKQQEDEAFERRLFGELLPRTFGERIGLDEVSK